jgi:large subunit ribosomal protein L29
MGGPLAWLAGTVFGDDEMSRLDELRDMSDEQLGLTLQEAAENLFRLKIQAQTERLDAPSELRRNRKLIARIKTIQTQRGQQAASAAT